MRSLFEQGIEVTAAGHLNPYLLGAGSPQRLQTYERLPNSKYASSKHSVSQGTFVVRQ